MTILPADISFRRRARRDVHRGPYGALQLLLLGANRLLSDCVVAAVGRIFGPIFATPVVRA